ncbi:MAG: hypothetical protein H7A48_14015, partial [Akkermansiaceae bacterium]|nr:hypothetical protein [Akkermansiaceae bacterium]
MNPANIFSTLSTEFLGATLPERLQPYLPETIAVLAGLFFGWLFTHLIASGKASAAAEKLKAEE